MTPEAKESKKDQSDHQIIAAQSFICDSDNLRGTQAGWALQPIAESASWQSWQPQPPQSSPTADGPSQPRPASPGPAAPSDTAASQD